MKTIATVASAILFGGAAGAREVYVAPDGDDSGAGTREKPFATLAAAVKALAPGDTCLLRGGVYRETLRPLRSGEPGRPIVFRAFPGETPVLSGADRLTGWKPETDGLWSAPMPWDLADRHQLFAGSTALVEARWPRTPPEEDVFLQPRRAEAAAGTTGSLTDPAIPGDADGWRGARLWCAGGAKWICWGARVTGFDPATHTLTFEGTLSAAWYTPKAGSAYVLMGARAALGGAGEWWFDRENGRVWMKPPPGCADPERAALEAKRRLAAADLRGLAHIQLVGLHIRAGGILTDADSAHLRFDGLRGDWVAHSYLADASAEAVVVDGRDHRVVNCEFRNSSAAVLRVAGHGHRIVNCLIERGNYGGLWNGALSVSGRGHLLRHNTVRHSGRDLLTIHGMTEGVIEYNDLSYAGWLTHDLGMIYGHDTDFGGTRIRYNHVHDCMAQGLAQGIYFDHCSHNLAIHHNRFWNIPDMPVQLNNPGYHNLVAHNTAWRTNTRSNRIHTFDHSGRNDLYGCRFLNNLFNAPFQLPAHVQLAGNRDEPDPGYVNPAGGDFRLREDSPARGTAVRLPGLNTGPKPDPGALSDASPPWRAGYDRAGSPDPDAPMDLPPIAGLNRLRNGCFERAALEDWTSTAAGSAALVKGNGWGNAVSGSGNHATGTSKHELQLGGGAAVSQRVEGLTPGRPHRLSAWLRVSDPVHGAELTVRDHGGAAVTLTCAATDWTRYELDFRLGPGATAATVEIRQRAGSPEEAKVWADNLGLVEHE